MAIEAAHYEKARQALAADPIVIAMAEEMAGAAGEWTHDDGSPTFRFMQLANAEYTRRGGKIGAHIGGVAEAVLRLIADKD